MLFPCLIGWRWSTIVKAAVFGTPLFAAANGLRAGVVFHDGSFAESDWSFQVIEFGNGGSVVASHVEDGGNPSAYRSISNTVNNSGMDVSIVHGYHIDSSFVYTPQLQGPIAYLSYQYDTRTLANVQVGIGLAIEQDGALFYGGYSIVTGGGWQPKSFSQLTATGFVNVFGSKLDFSADAPPLRLGILAANSQNPFSAGYTATVNIDNFKVVIIRARDFGDYNHNGVVDAADYVVWRNSIGGVGSNLAADGNLDGKVDDEDYELWRANFGTDVFAGSAAAAKKDSAAVPEPATAMLMVIGMIALICKRNSSYFSLAGEG